MIVFSFLRSLIGLVLFIIWTALMSSLFILGLWVRLPRGFGNRVICVWGEGVLKLFGVQVKEVGRENLIEGSCLYLFSHTSFFDVFAMAARLSGMRFGAKSELFKIPIFGPAMKLAGVLPITRNNREKVMRVYERASKRAMKGRQFALSPEGGRNFEEKLLPFKAGPFVFAIQAKMPVIPVVIHGALEVLHPDSILPNWKKWSSTITLTYLPMIAVDSYEIETRQELQRRVFDQMKAYF